MDVSAGNVAAQPEPRMSALFCDPTADITFLSSDHVVFKIHGTHINSNSDGFAISENIIVEGGPAELPEPSKTLEVLFQFIEPPSESRNYRQPSVLDMESSLFFAVAEAAEKYVVYGAMNICLTRMQQLIPHHALEILNHCAKHGYDSIADQAAEQALSAPLDMAATKLTAPGVLPRYLIYYHKWRDAGDAAAQLFETKMKGYPCLILNRVYAMYLRQIHSKPASFKAIPMPPASVAPPECAQYGACLCRTLRVRCPWADELAAMQVDIPKFSADPLSGGIRATGQYWE